MKLQLGALWASVVTVVLAAAAPLAAQQAGPPPLSAYGALPAVQSVEISPDGASIAYIRREGEASHVVAVGRDGTPLVIVDTSDRRVRYVRWASPDHVLVVSATTEKLPFFAARTENHLVDIINVRTQNAARAMKSSDQEAYNAILGWTVGQYRGQPALYVQAVTENEGYLHTLDLYAVDLNSGRGRRQMQGESDTQDFIVRRDGEVVARTAYNPQNGQWRLSTRSGGVWRDIHRARALLDRPAVLGLGRSTDTIAVAEEVDGDWRLVEIGLTSGADQARADIGASPNDVLHDAEGRLIGVGYMGLYQDYEFFEPSLAEAWTTLKAALPGRQLTLTSFSDDLKVIAFYVEGTGEPGGYYLYDAAAKRVSLVGRAYPGLSGADIAEVQLVRYKAQDGLDLFGYLTLPNGRERRDLPLVVMPHGGPAARDTGGFDWQAQAIASRGYAVFQPQFRGSDGFGVALLEAGYGEWGRKMQSDVSDGLRHLAANGLIDPDRACIVGGSYGGYVALAGMTLEPGVYRCAVSIAGVSDLRAMLLEEQRQGARGDANPTVRYWKRFMGADSANDLALDARSPALQVAPDTGPILLIHGRNDITVPFAQSELMQKALGSRGEGALVTLADEDHYMSTEATRQQMLSATMAFLETHNPAD
ncbi:MAG: S9 family peptidase [Pseudomonadota bacterium]|nr:S9 family peptidase [Pseudomonadota bacterium]